MTNKLAKRGFTLIELLVVVLIIGILAAVAVPQYQKAVEKARATEIISNVNTLSKTAEMYVLSGNTEDVGVQDLEIPLSGCVYEDRKCYTKHATYFFGCTISEGLGGATDCYLETARVDGCITSNGTVDDSKCDYSNMWTISRVWTNGQMTANDCVTQLTDTGRTICKSLENQGYEFVDADM